jgi:hypothetical protein
MTDDRDQMTEVRLAAFVVVLVLVLVLVPRPYKFGLGSIIGHGLFVGWVESAGGGLGFSVGGPT